MRTHGRHDWRYHSTWHERKRGKGLWWFSSPQEKVRLGRQTKRWHGTPRNTVFIWRVRAVQHMRKVGRNRYVGGMTGVKSLLGRRRG